MRHLLLDTCAYSALDRGHAELSAAIHAADSITVSAVTLGELRAGFKRGTLEGLNESKLVKFLSSPRIAVVPIDAETSHFHGQIMAYLRRLGKPIPTNAIWIAASAMQHGLRLVTTDRHFREIPQVIVDYYEPAT